jgi:uncharacterized RDD family membrane protein YckC
VSGETPGLARRLASLLYESVLVFAIAFFAGFAFLLASGAAQLEGWLLHAHQAFLVAVLGAYFLWCWLRGGQTLAMKAWRIRLDGVTPRRALARFLLAVALVPTGIGLLWALVDRDRQFLHDRIAGTRLVRA